MNLQQDALLKMVQLGSVRQWAYLVKPEFFDSYNAEVYATLVDYETQYDKCMSPATFRAQFPDFDYREIDVDLEWLADELNEKFIEVRMEQHLAEMTEVIHGEPKKTTKQLRDILNTELAQYLNHGVAGEDLFSSIAQTIEEEKRVGISEMSGITLGIELLDQVCYGSHPGELEIWAARPGNGKSFLLLYTALKAIEQGKRVSFISPEMLRREMALRLASLHLHCSLMHLQSGHLSEEEVESFKHILGESAEGIAGEIKFYRPDRRYSIDVIRGVLQQDRPDILIIDGLMFIDPATPQRDLRMSLVSVCADLKNEAIRTQTPIRVAHQCNRESEQRMTKKVQTKVVEMIPRLHELAESGATEQFSNRVIMFKMHEGRMFVAVRKNRMGPQDRIFSFKFSANEGLIDDFRLEGLEAEAPEEQQSLNYEESF